MVRQGTAQVAPVVSGLRTTACSVIARALKTFAVYNAEVCFSAFVLLVWHDGAWIAGVLPCSWRAWTGVGTYGTLIEEWEECVWAATTLRQKASSEGSARKCARMTDAGATWCGRGQRRLLLWCQAYELRHAVSLQGP